MGSDTRQGIDMAVNIINGLISGDMTGAAAGALAPKIALIIKGQTEHYDPITGERKIDYISNTVCHAILGAVVAELQGNSALAGGLGATASERGAEIIAGMLYPGKSVDKLSQDEKQQISALAQLATALAVAAGGGDIQDINTAVAGGKNAVENNFLGPQDQSRLEQLRKKRDESFLNQSEKIEMFMLDELDQKGDYLVGKYYKDPNSLTDAETQQLAASLSRYYQQVEGMSGKQAAAQAVNDLLTGNWGYRAHNYDYPYLGTKEQQEQYNNDYWDSVANKSLIEKLFSSRPMDENEEYYRDQYNIQKYIQSTEWERQVGRPVMNFLPGGIGFVYNTTDTLQGSYALGEGIGQVYRDGEFKTDSVLKMVDGVLTLAPVVASNIIPKGNSSTVAGKGTAANKPLDKTDLELQHGKGNVEQGGGNYKETKDKILDNQAANQKANESSKFGEHVAKEQEINAGKGTSQVKPIVIAELEVNGKKFTDTNQTARASDKANVNEPTLIADKIRDKEISTGKELPNGNMANAHAEIGVIQQAHNAGLAKGADLKITVTGKEICSYCRSDIVSSAKAADVKSVTIYEEKTGLTYYWRRGMKKLEVQN